MDHAPEPDELKWENLEVVWWDHDARKFITGVLTTLSVLIGFIVVVQASIFKREFSKNVPSLSACGTHIPQLYSQNHTLSAGVRESSIVLTRPLESDTSSNGRTYV